MRREDKFSIEIVQLLKAITEYNHNGRLQSATTNSSDGGQGWNVKMDENHRGQSWWQRQIICDLRYNRCYILVAARVAVLTKFVLCFILVL